MSKNLDFFPKCRKGEVEYTIGPFGLHSTEWVEDLFCMSTKRISKIEITFKRPFPDGIAIQKDSDQNDIPEIVKSQASQNFKGPFSTVPRNQ